MEEHVMLSLNSIVILRSRIANEIGKLLALLILRPITQQVEWLPYKQ